MKPLLIWFIGYAIPALIAGTAIQVLPRGKGRLNIRNAIIIHAALFASILISQYFIYIHKLAFPWFPGTLSVLVYVGVVLFISRLLGSVGFWYGISAFIQQLTILSITFLLLPVYPLYLVVLLIIPFYAYSHLLSARNRILRIVLFLIWGVLSIFIYSVLPNIFLLASLHTLFGELLISRSLLYPER